MWRRRGGAWGRVVTGDERRGIIRPSLETGQHFFQGYDFAAGITGSARLGWAGGCSAGSGNSKTGDIRGRGLGLNRAPVALPARTIECRSLCVRGTRRHREDGSRLHRACASLQLTCALSSLFTAGPLSSSQRSNAKWRRTRRRMLRRLGARRSVSDLVAGHLTIRRSSRKGQVGTPKAAGTQGSTHGASQSRAQVPSAPEVGTGVLPRGWQALHPISQQGGAPLRLQAGGASEHRFACPAAHLLLAPRDERGGAEGDSGAPRAVQRDRSAQLWAAGRQR